MAIFPNASKGKISRFESWANMTLRGAYAQTPENSA
jgi:hypothetical protein